MTERLNAQGMRSHIEDIANRITQIKELQEGITQDLKGFVGTTGQYFYPYNDFMRSHGEGLLASEKYEMHDTFMKDPKIEVGQSFLNISHPNTYFSASTEYLVVEYNHPMVTMRTKDTKNYLACKSVHSTVGIHINELLENMLYSDKQDLTIIKYSLLMTGVSSDWSQMIDQEVAKVQFGWLEDISATTITDCSTLIYNEIFGLYIDTYFINPTNPLILNGTLPSTITVMPARNNGNWGSCKIVYEKEREDSYDLSKNKGESFNIPKNWFNVKCNERKLMILEKSTTTNNILQS